MADEPKPKRLPQIIAVVAAGTGVLAAGCVHGWFNNIQHELESKGYHGIVFHTDDSGLTGSLVLLGAFFISFIGGYISDIIGRKTTLLITAAPLLVGWALIIFAQNLIMILIGRFILGLAVGTAAVIMPMYTAEVAHASIRGALGVLYQFFFVAGALVAAITGHLVSVLIHNIISAGIGGFFFVIFLFQPESPVYLIKKKKRAAAQKALTRLRGKNYNVENELKEIEDYESNHSGQKVNYKQALRTKAARRSILIVFGCMCIQQLSGVNAIAVYTAEIFRSAGIDEHLVPYAAMSMMGIHIITVYIATHLIERFGRKILLLLSTFVVALSVLAYGFYVMVKDREMASKETLDSISWIAIIIQLIYSVAFGLGLGPIPWFLAPELIPPDIKGLMCSCVGGLSWLLGFLVSRYYLILAQLLGADVCFLFFGVGDLLGCVFIWFFVFETKGIPFEEIQAILNK